MSFTFDRERKRSLNSEWGGFLPSDHPNEADVRVKQM